MAERPGPFRIEDGRATYLSAASPDVVQALIARTRMAEAEWRTVEADRDTIRDLSRRVVARVVAVYRPS